MVSEASTRITRGTGALAAYSQPQPSMIAPDGWPRWTRITRSVLPMQTPSAGKAVRSGLPINAAAQAGGFGAAASSVGSAFVAVGGGSAREARDFSGSVQSGREQAEAARRTSPATAIRAALAVVPAAGVSIPHS